MKSNLCLIGLANKYTKKVADGLSKRLGMLYADVNEMLEFDLIDVLEAREKTSGSYIDSLESKKIKELASYENIIVGMDYKTFMKKNNSQIAKDKCYVIYLELPKQIFFRATNKEYDELSQRKLEEMMYEENNKFCKDKCDFVVKIESLNVINAIKTIIDFLKNYEF